MTPAYIIFIKKTTNDANELDHDSAIAGERFEGRQIELFAADAWQEVLEAASAEGTVVLKFPDWDSAKHWYYGRTLQEEAPYVFAGALYQAILVEGHLTATAPA